MFHVKQKATQIMRAFLLDIFLKRSGKVYK